jgi:hypothetical protein
VRVRGKDNPLRGQYGMGRGPDGVGRASRPREESVDIDLNLRVEAVQPVGSGRRDELHSGPDISRGPAWLLLYSGVDTLFAS